MKASSKDVTRDVQFLNKVEGYFYFDNELTDSITNWARDHCSTFVDKDPRSREQPLHHQELHVQYCTLFETLLESFLKDNGLAIIDFYVILRREIENAEIEAMRGGRPLVSSTFANVLNSVIDFFGFCEIMYDVNMGGDAVFCPPLIDISDYYPAEGKSCNDTQEEDDDFISYKK